jgi:uncharacterized protein with PQ loop repeat
MDISIEIIISSMAAILTTSSFLPQTVKVIINKKKDEARLFIFIIVFLMISGISLQLVLLFG